MTQYNTMCGVFVWYGYRNTRRTLGVTPYRRRTFSRCQHCKTHDVGTMQDCRTRDPSMNCFTFQLSAQSRYVQHLRARTYVPSQPSTRLRQRQRYQQPCHAGVAVAVHGALTRRRGALPWETDVGYLHMETRTGTRKERQGHDTVPGTR